MIEARIREWQELGIRPCESDFRVSRDAAAAIPRNISMHVIRAYHVEAGGSATQ